MLVMGGAETALSVPTASQGLDGLYMGGDGW
jgi:hypothetical protein